MFADIEQKIIERLRAVLPADVHVGPYRDMESIKANRNKAPAAWVIHDGYTTGDTVAPGTIQQVRQEWFVVVVAKSSRGNGDVEAARDQADELCDAVLGGLLGYHLGGGKYLRLMDAPGPEYDGGYCHVPLAFSNAATFKGTP